MVFESESDGLLRLSKGIAATVVSIGMGEEQLALCWVELTKNGFGCQEEKTMEGLSQEERINLN